ncbi:MAG: Fur family transcriptional regulator [Limnochordia bacterium]
MAFENSLQKLKEHRLKITPQRAGILKVILQARRPLTVQEIYTRVRRGQPQISLDTVYRTVNLFVEIGLINHINVPSRTVYEYQGEGEHRHYALCLSCGENFRLDLCPTAALAPPPSDPAFQILGHTFEAYGYCSSCRHIGQQPL